MALYDPIRDGFREFNRMLEDSQQWDAAHAQRAADTKYKNTVLQSSLVQREFENQMSEKRQLLLDRGDVRAEKQLDLTTKTTNQALMVGLRQLEIANLQENRAADNGVRAAETHTAVMKNYAQTLRSATAAANKATQPYTAIDVDLNAVVGERKNNPEYMDRLNTNLRNIVGEDAYIEDDLFVKRYDGTTGESTVLRAEPAETKKYLPVILALNAEFDSPAKNAMRNIEKLTDQQDQLKAIANSRHGSSYALTERAMAKRAVNKLDVILKDQYSTFRPDTAAEQYTNRANMIATGAEWDTANGFPEEGLAKFKIAEQLRMQAIAAKNIVKGERTPIWKRELSKEGKAIPVDEVVWNTISETYTRTVKDKDGNETRIEMGTLPADETAEKPTEDYLSKKDAASGSGEMKMAPHVMKGFENVRKTITPQLSLIKADSGENAAAEQAQSYYVELVAERSPKNAVEVLQAQKAAEKELITKHNELANLYMSKEKQYGAGSNKFQAWIDQKYMPLIEKNGFPYAPIEKYRLQVRGVDQ